MSRIEKRLWLVFVVLFAGCLIGSAALTSTPLDEFFSVRVAALRHAMRPEREARKFEKASSVNGVMTIAIETTQTNIRVVRVEAMNDLAVTLEGRFPRSDLEPLQVSRSGDRLVVHVDEGHLEWGQFDDENHNSELSLVLPRQFSGNVEITTVSGDTRVSDLSLSALTWKSVSGSLEAHSGEMHIVKLSSVSGDVDYQAESLELGLNVTSGHAHIVLRGLEHITAGKYDLQTTSGLIDCAVAPQASLRLSLSSFTGEATSSVPLKTSMHSGGASEGEMNGGGGELRMRAVSGSVRLSTY